MFLPHDRVHREAVERLIADIVAEEGQRLIGWRDVPTNDGLVGPSAVAVEPVFRQIFIGLPLSPRFGDYGLTFRDGRVTILSKVVVRICTMRRW